MKKNFYIMTFVIFFYFVPFSYSFYHKFSEEPYINIMSPKISEFVKIKFNLQHHYADTGVASANFRLGYSFFKNFDIYISGLFHSIEITSGNDRAKVSVKEYEIINLKSLITESENKILDLAILFGVSKFSFLQMFNNRDYTDNRDYYFFHLLISKTIDEFLITTFSPVFIYDSKDKKNITGIVSGLKLNYIDKISLVLEYPLFIENPYNWKQPWGTGIQFHLMPHILTIFFTNTYGFTNSNIFQGWDKTFFGFRFSF